MTIEHISDRPPSADTAVVFACDQRYSQYTHFAATQIARLKPDRTFDICLCSTEALEPVLTLAGHRLRLCRVEARGLFSGMKVDARRSQATYLRLLLPLAFRGSYRRLLYLDSDVFVQAGDFEALLEVDLGRHAVGAVRDNSQWRTPGRRPAFFRRTGLPSAAYFNAGALLVDVAAFNAQLVWDRCLAVASVHADAARYLDQDLLNAALQGDWAELSPVWNWQYTWASRSFEAMADANIIHFIGHKKPWNHTGGEFPLRFRRAYRDFFTIHFPQVVPLGLDGVTPMANPVFLRKAFAKHLLSVGKMSAYLGRFETELTVVT